LEKFVTIELFGTLHKLKTEDSEVDAERVVQCLVEEIDAAGNKMPSKPSQANPFNVLLLAALNMASKYVKLETEHRRFSREISERYEALKKKIDGFSPSVASETVTAAKSPPEKNAPEKSEPKTNDSEKSNPETTGHAASDQTGESLPNDQTAHTQTPLSPEKEEMTKEVPLKPASSSEMLSPNREEDDTAQDKSAPQPAEPSAATPPATNRKKQTAGGSETPDTPPVYSRPGPKFQLPPISFLTSQTSAEKTTDPEHLKAQAERLKNKLSDFGINGEVVKISPGPVITTFEYRPAPGVKISRIVNLSDDLALALSALSIRIVAPIPGRDVIGIELPNDRRKIVYLKDIVASSEFFRAKSKLSLCLGQDIIGQPVTTALDKMPHLLIAGATGTGKSVALNAMITSILYKATPNEVKFIMIDPKRIELSFYNDIPHLITPVVTDMKKATNALFWAVKEMEKRYDLLAENKVKNIRQYNREVRYGRLAEAGCAPLPFIVVIIDELADLMMVSSRDVEVALARLAQMARAAGIHLVLATQRPSVDVLTGVIKANFPTRISFQVSSKIDSRTIIDSNGAENLLGNGDMLFLPPGTAKLARIHGAYISEEELTKVISFLKQQSSPDYIEDVTEVDADQASEVDKEEYDERYDEAVALVTKTRQASISAVQRHMRIGYNRAARMIETMEKEGIVGPPDGAKPREVLVQRYEELSENV
jgi:S-DNA-T family DNA segregation ATPase FtsK/SpoIIIE